MTREELHNLNPDEFKEFFVKTLAESRELDTRYNDFIAKSLSAKVREEKFPQDKAEELILDVAKRNKSIEAFFEQLELPRTVTDRYLAATTKEFNLETYLAIANGFRSFQEDEVPPASPNSLSDQDQSGGGQSQSILGWLLSHLSGNRGFRGKLTSS